MKKISVYAPGPGNAWFFHMNLGHQGTHGKRVSNFGLAVRSGHVSTAPVPVPGAFWLLDSGLIGLAGVSRRKKGNCC